MLRSFAVITTTPNELCAQLHDRRRPAPRNRPFARDSIPGMIRIANTAKAFDAIAATLRLGSVGFEPQLNATGERWVWLEVGVVDRLGAMRSPRRRLFRRQPAAG
jgi:hypothetical protein